MPELKLLKLHSCPIYKQLQIEEALLRNSNNNYCILNHGADKAIVMGISGKIHQLIENPCHWPHPIIKRYSGGGCVLVDKNTIFVTFICNADECGVKPYPQEIMEWTSDFYEETLATLPFSLRENDYLLENKKFGGNAQYIRKKRFVHHSSLLWDFDSLLMEKTLKFPPKSPEYRKHRSHKDFLCILKNLFESKLHFQKAFIESLKKRFNVSTSDLNELSPFLKSPFRQGTKILRPDTSLALKK
jgi:lipoate---protein ligase